MSLRPDMKGNTSRAISEYTDQSVRRVLVKTTVGCDSDGFVKDLGRTAMFNEGVVVKKAPESVKEAGDYTNRQVCSKGVERKRMQQ